ncbi:MAG TPA: mercuric reductase [Puia sp.]|jgi:pyruvate/2-oxoglutarate dehydrogenase complex dihydrolipoamide dehydrogenase (E3) component|nr:mercuric reductase [Puia sp.]
MTKYDAILVGSGQAATPLARKLAAAGWKTALIERQWVGGTCINVGCTPTKTMIASGRVAYLVKRSADFGIRTAGFDVDAEAFVRRKNSVVVAARESDTQSLIRTPNLDLIFGTASFTGPKELTITMADGSVETATADHIFVNTGASPFVPPIPGLTEVPYLTSATILDLMAVPRHLAVIGAGYVALEFAQLYRRLGSAVTILEGGSRFLPAEDDDIAGEIRKILEDDGIRISLETHVTQVIPGDPVRLELQYSGDGHAGSGEVPPFISVSHVLVATGRRPDTIGLNTAAAGIRLDEHGHIAVNGRLETSVPGIFALGDVKGGPQFTHVSWNDHLIVYKNLIEKANLSTENRVTVYCLFTDPELGRVGLTEKEARAKGLNIKVATMPASYVARAVENSETRGLLKVIVNADDRKILGAAMLISGGGELMSIVQMAMTGGVSCDTVRDAMYAHPTFAEALNNLFAKL